MDLSLFHLQTRCRSRPRSFYENVPFQCELEFNRDDFTAVDTHYDTCGIVIVSTFYNNTTPLLPVHTHSVSLREAFNDLPSSLQCLCGDVHIPPDDGREILHHILASNKLLGASDAAFKKGHASHAWVLYSGEIDDIGNKDLHIYGSGPMD
jgi:hypothetical protein